MNKKLIAKNPTAYHNYAIEDKLQQFVKKIQQNLLTLVRQGAILEAILG